MSRPRILFVTKSVPFPPTAGSSQRTANLIEALEAVGEVSLFVIGPKDRRPFLEQAGYRVAATAEPTMRSSSRVGRFIGSIAPGRADALWRVYAGVAVDFTPDPGLWAALQRTVSHDRYDLLVGRYLVPSIQAGLLETGMPPAIVDIDDVDSKAVAAKMRSPASSIALRVLLRARLGAVQEFEKIRLGQAGVLWFSNPDDMALAPGSGQLVPNIPFSMPDKNALSHSSVTSRTILWVGSFNHRVNLDGVELFLRKAWREILHIVPDARFRIVGSGLPDRARTRWLALPGVDVVGFAETLAPHYADAAMSIVPLFDGAGTKIKVLESLAYLRTCVVAKHSIAGFESLLPDGGAVRVVTRMEGFAQAVADLFWKPHTRHAMEASGRTLVERHFTRQAVRDAVTRSVSGILESAAHG
jgi:glycosyltransferase involved in cell wall biosynthesis